MGNLTECFLVPSKGHSESQAAFAQAIALGVLSDDVHAPNFAGNWMYMGRDSHGLSFKNINLRNYIHCLTTKAVQL